MIDRATKRFGSAKVKDGPGKNEQKSEAAAEKKAEAPASGAKATGKTVEMKPNASGATAEAESPHGQMYGRHAEDLKAMHGRHMQEIKDMHGRHADEMTQMHGRHATEVGSGAGAAAHEGPSLPSAKAAAGKGWKTRDKGKAGTEPKAEKKDGGK